MTPEERRRRGTMLCEKLTREVAEIAPPGIGHWDRAWELVSDADASFMLALTRWEATGSDDDKPALREAYFAVLNAWRTATAEFNRHQQGAER